ncbi:MAG: hypothetical protein ABFD98_06440 [Syntrophobacteraceae bacterium]|nr:hypothetical protein [Desulfobacteraceae bacterium]
MNSVDSSAAQSRKTGMLRWFTMACAAAAALSSIQLFLACGLQLAVAGEQASFPVCMVWGATVAFLGIAPALGIWIYGLRHMVGGSSEAVPEKISIITEGTPAHRAKAL